MRFQGNIEGLSKPLTQIFAVIGALTALEARNSLTFPPLTGMWRTEFTATQRQSHICEDPVFPQ
ncbi:MAG: hypothetical protein Rhims3KO_33830 [Hyphomicrobiales bacterium]